MVEKSAFALLPIVNSPERAGQVPAKELKEIVRRAAAKRLVSLFMVFAFLVLITAYTNNIGYKETLVKKGYTNSYLFITKPELCENEK